MLKTECGRIRGSEIKNPRQESVTEIEDGGRVADVAVFFLIPL